MDNTLPIQILRDAGKSIERSATLTSILAELVDNLHAYGAFIALTEETSAEMLFVAGVAPFTPGYTYSLAKTPCEIAIRAASPTVFLDNVADMFPDDKPLARYSVRGYAAAPLHIGSSSGGFVLGVVSQAPLQTVAETSFIMRVAAAKTTAAIRKLIGGPNKNVNYFKTVFDNTPVGISLYRVIGDNIILEDMNSFGQKILNEDLTTVAGKDIRDIFPSVTPEVCAQIIKTNSTGEQFHDKELRYIEPGNLLDGFYDLKIFQVTDGLVALSFNNITGQVEERRKNEELSAMHAAIIDHTSIFVGLLDNKGNVLFTNKASQDFVGIKSNIEVAGVPFEDTPWWNHDPQMQENLKECIKTAQSGKFAKKEVTHYTQEGRAMEVDFRLKPVFDKNGSVRYLLAEGTDITELKTAATALVDFDETKTSFITTAAHELRTPLAAIMGFAEFLVAPEDFGGFSPKQTKDFVGEIIQKADSLSGLIDDLLDLSRLDEESVLNISPVEISPEVVCRRVVASKQLANSRRKIKFHSTLPEGEVATLDPVRLGQVLTNLLTNAFKYSEPDTDVIVGLIKTGTNHLELSVKDFGIGIKRGRDRELIFNNFYRIDRSLTAPGGLGLGLSICKQIVEAHGGHIQVASTVGKGSTFTASFPL